MKERQAKFAGVNIRSFFASTEAADIGLHEGDPVGIGGEFVTLLFAVGHALLRSQQSTRARTKN